LNQRGFTLLEITLAGLMALLLSVGMAYAYKQASVISTSTVAKLDASQDMVRLISHMMRIGRMARANGCTVVRTPDPHLACWLDMKTPPTEATTDDTQVRFRLDAAQRIVFYEVNTGSAFVVKDRYQNISDLQLCDDAAMIAGVCELADAVTARHVANRTSGTWQTDANRFYRFRVRAEQGTTSKKVSLAGAFYVRHPTPIANMRYQFGLRE